MHLRSTVCCWWWGTKFPAKLNTKHTQVIHIVPMIPTITIALGLIMSFLSGLHILPSFQPAQILAFIDLLISDVTIVFYFQNLKQRPIRASFPVSTQSSSLMLLLPTHVASRKTQLTTAPFWSIIIYQGWRIPPIQFCMLFMWIPSGHQPSVLRIAVLSIVSTLVRRIHLLIGVSFSCKFDTKTGVARGMLLSKQSIPRRPVLMVQKNGYKETSLPEAAGSDEEWEQDME